MPARLPTLALIGCGNMGSALLHGWLQQEHGRNYLIVEPHSLPAAFLSHKNIRRAPSPESAADELQTAQTVVLAVKPQIIRDVCAQLAPCLPESALIISIAAGTTLHALEQVLGGARPIIRAMPNTPAAIGKGISVLTANRHVTPAQKESASFLLKPAGQVTWIDDEKLMDAVTALSGSGPAYIFHLIEILSEAGKSIGLPAALAQTLARQTVIGSAALADKRSDIDAATLRQQVTSPGGTTAAALDVLMNGKLQEIYNAALAAAKKRGEELND
mgnify:FL=1